MKLRKTIIALDISLRNTGVAVYSISERRFIYSEVIKTQADKQLSPSADNLRCCQIIYKRLVKLTAAFKPVLIVAEVPTGGGKNYNAVVGMNLVTATLACFLAHDDSLEFFHVTPNQVKRMVNPAKRVAVDKKQVMKFAEYRFGDSVLPKTLGEREHVADAMTSFAVYQTSVDGS